MLRNKLITTGIIGCVVTGAGLLAAAPATAADTCSASRFCGYDGKSYTSKLVDSGATGGTVDVTDNKLSSAHNNRDKVWCAVNVEVGINIIRFRFAANTSNSSVSYDNTTDFLWVKGSGTC